MKEDDLNRLEHSDEVKRIVDISKVLYDKINRQILHAHSIL